MASNVQFLRFVLIRWWYDFGSMPICFVHFVISLCFGCSACFRFDLRVIPFFASLVVLIATYLG